MKRLFSLLTALSLCLALAGCGGDYESYTLLPKEFLLGEKLNEAGEVVEPETFYNDTRQLSERDIQTMNDGSAVFAYNDEGYVSFLQGRFSEDRVESYEDAVAVVNGVASLIGLGAGSEFFAVYYSVDASGYTYYTFQQRYGDATVQYATLRIVVDPEGYTAGLSCSFTPNLGIADETKAISAAEAEAIVLARFPDYELECYPEHTARVAVTIHDVSYHAYAVYTNNPNSNAGDFDMLYFEHFVSVSGEYLSGLPVAGLSTSSMNAFKAEDYFLGLESSTLDATVTRWDGTKETISVPLAYNPKTGLYYLADVERRIMAANFYPVIYQGVMDFISSADRQGFDNDLLLAYDRFVKVYDFYGRLGVDSVNATGMPILLCYGYCDGSGEPVDNAGYCGVNLGWACFGISQVNDYCEALDVVGHEFTHGVTAHSFNGVYYANETGAINEALSDIMGNICEMSIGATTDLSWLVGENCGYTFRSMSSPGLYQQPTELGGRFYYPPAEEPMDDPDYGGVHVNSSLLGQMAYKLWDEGMSFQQQSALWMTAIELTTPLSGYEELYAALLMSVDINGLDVGYKQLITQWFSQAGMIEGAAA